MLPSPARRSSPGRELRLENKHKRGCSLDCGPPHKKKEDDLALFTDMQMREKDNLLISNEDFEDSLAKLKCNRDYPFGMSIHVRRGSNDMLNVDSDKNDYDWLLTPPDTPLFPYLDDDELPPSNLSTARGRLRNQPMHIHTSSMTEKSQKSSRSSASPHRLSPSPRSIGSTVQSRGRSSAAPQSSPVAVVRPTTSSRRSLTPNKSSSPDTRPSTTTPRRMSVDSNLQTSSSGRRGNSPMKGSRGGSASPKLQGWQSTIPGFTSDAPPNLRTSLNDRPLSYTRGSSPASRNGRDLSSRISRQSMSPTASRSASSSQSYDPDRTSPHSKDSSTSYADEDLESLPSVSMGVSASPITRKNGVFASNKPVGFSKKPSRTLSVNSAPKRSLDSTLKQMDQHKTPQNMFRPLLSSVPISSFYIGKANAMHRPVFSRNSSLTTSSNASSELGASVAPEAADHDTVDHAGEWDKMSDSLLQEEGFIFEKMDEIKEDIMHDLVSEKSLSGRKSFDVSITKGIAFDESRSSSLAKPVVHPLLTDSHNHLECSEHILCERTCIICRKIFYVSESTDSNYNICEECSEKSELPVLSINDMLGYQEENIHQMPNLADCSFDKTQLMAGAPDVSEETNHMDISCQVDYHDELARQLDCHPEKYLSCLRENSDGVIAAEKTCHDHLPEVQQLLGSKDWENSSFQLPSWEKKHFHHEVESKIAVDPPDSTHRPLQQQSSEASSNLKVESPEATGISVLLQRSNSIKGPLVQTRVLTASTLHYDEPSYARENANFINKNFSRNNTSASSSVDMGMSVQTEVHVHRQSSTRQNDYDNAMTVSDVMVREQALSPRTSVKTGENTGCDSLDEKNESNNESAYSLRRNSIERSHVHVLLEEAARYSSQSVVSSVKDNSQTTSSGKLDDLSQSFPLTEGAEQIDWSTTMLQTSKGFLHHDDNDVDKSRCSFVNRDEYTDTSFSVVVHNDEDSFDGTLRSSSTTSMDTPTYATAECIKLENTGNTYAANDTELSHSQSLSSMSEKELSAYTKEYENENAAAEESAVIMEDLPRQKPERPGSPTPREATDTVLFCSSIVHDLVYKAATIGIEKETTTSQFLRPTSTVLVRPASYQREQTRVLNKRTANSTRVKRDSPETDAKVQETEPLKSELHDSPKSNPIPSRKVENPKPPSKCNCTIM